MAARRGIYLFSLVACLIFYSAYQLWFAGFLLTAILGLPLFSLLVSLPAMLTARVELGLPDAVTQGTKQELVLWYSSRFPTPPWRCRVLVEQPLTGGNWIMKDVKDLPTAHCGTMVFTIRKAKVCDYLGLFALPMRKGRPCRMQVRPRPVSMPMPSLERHLTKSFRPKPGGGFAENHELRLYRPGDSIQQIHWKLSAKTGSLILREPMEPVRSRMLLQLDLTGTPGELDRKLGKLLWLGKQLLEKDLHFQLQALTGSGVESWSVTDLESLQAAIDDLLLCAPAREGTIRGRHQSADWRYFIGGGTDETR